MAATYNPDPKYTMMVYFKDGQSPRKFTSFQSEEKRDAQIIENRMYNHVCKNFNISAIKSITFATKGISEVKIIQTTKEDDLKKQALFKMWVGMPTGYNGEKTFYAPLNYNNSKVGNVFNYFIHYVLKPVFNYNFNVANFYFRSSSHLPFSNYILKGDEEIIPASYIFHIEKGHNLMNREN